MLKELFGMLLGWAVITIIAWFLSLGLVGYVLGDINPFHWDMLARSLHLMLQLVLIVAYAAAVHGKTFRRGS